MDGVHFPANIPILRCDISPVQCILGASSGIKRPGCEVDHSSRYEYEYIYIYIYIKVITVLCLFRTTS